MTEKKKKEVLQPSELTDRDDVADFVSREIAKILPAAFIQQAIVKSIEAHITDFRVQDWTVEAALKEVVMEKTKELLRTRFATQIEEMAEKLAQKAIANGGRY